jgi:hypothetical protein
MHRMLADLRTLSESAGRAWLLLLAISVASTLAPTTALAGTYSVYGCRAPDGSPQSTDGWQRRDTSAVQFAGDSCRQSAGVRSLWAIWANTSPDLSEVGWEFPAPINTLITAYDIYRYAAMGNPLDGVVYYAPREDDVISSDWCSGVPGNGCWQRGALSAPPLDPANRLAVSNVHVARLRLVLACRSPGAGSGTGQCSAGTSPGTLHIFATRIELEDLVAPSFTSAPEGTLLDTTAPMSGEKTVRFAARDYGGGLMRMGLVVDGQTYADQLVDPTNARCQVPFSSRVPCPLETVRTIAFDTATVPNGAHSVRVAIQDAAGNRTLSEPMLVMTRNGGPPNGRGASRFARLNAWFVTAGERRAARVVSYGRSRWTAGRLTDSAGRPIAAAAIDVLTRTRRPGAAWRPRGSVVTSEDGTFRYRPNVGPSRVVRFEYRAFTFDEAPTASFDATLNVRAGVVLAVAPRRVAARGRITFHGHLRGGPGRLGAQVQLFAVARQGRDRVPVATLRADRRGRFRFRYRFRRTFAPFTYYFQAVVGRQSGYPYVTGRSRRVAVRVVR